MYKKVVKKYSWDGISVKKMIPLLFKNIEKLKHNNNNNNNNNALVNTAYKEASWN
ncbi:MAG: hypothetical protein ACI9WV_000117 [Patiriisocius sp.]|jgi:hypothetical protein